MDRLYFPIRKSHLRVLARIAEAERFAFFARSPARTRLYENRFLASALCQGAALHYLKGKTGVKDFDIHLFYVQHPRHRQLSRAVKSLPEEFADFGVRRVDFIRTVVPVRILESSPSDITAVLRRFLAEAPTSNARYLAEKAVVGLVPQHLFAKTIWPTKDLAILRDQRVSMNGTTPHSDFLSH